MITEKENVMKMLNKPTKLIAMVLALAAVAGIWTV